MNSNYFNKMIHDFYHAPAFTKVFLVGFFICFLTEGTGVISKNVVFSLFLLFPLVLFLFSLRIKKGLLVKNIWILPGSFIYLLYLFYLTNFSLNRQISFEFIIFLFSLFLLFVIVMQQWREVEKSFLWSLLGLGVLLSLYSFILSLGQSSALFYLYPHYGYQYVYMLFGSNHLGEFLVFPMLISFSWYIQRKQNFFLLLFIFFLPFFLFSYSRTAYLGFFFGFILLWHNYKNELFGLQKKLVIGSIIGVILFFLLISSHMLSSEFAGRKVNKKSVIETRETYLLQGLKGFLTYRYYGVGVHNFEYVSRMFTETPGGWTTSSHNIFFDVLVETGTVSFVFFVIFAVLLLRTIKKNHLNIFAVLLFSWFVMAQFDYLHKLYSYLLLFPLFLAGLVCHSAGKSPSWRTTDRISVTISILLSIFLSLFLILYITSGVLLQQGEYTRSRTIYPLQRQAYKNEIMTKNESRQDQRALLTTYTHLYPGESFGFLKIGKIYEKEGNISKTIENYEKSFWLDPFQNLSMVQTIYNMKLKHEGKRNAKKFADTVFIRLQNDTGDRPLRNEYWLFSNKFCQKVYDLHCPYTLQ